MKLYFTRHGKTRWNDEKRFQGMMGDSPLLPESLTAIDALGQELKDISFEKIYTSSLKRAYLTAEGINKQLATPVEIIRTDDLRELGLGTLEGQLIPVIEERYPKDMVHLRQHLDLYDPTPFDGEPIEDMLQRINQFVEKAVTEAKEGPLLFVGHGAALTAAIQSLTGKPLAELRDMGGLYNNSLTILEADASQPPYKMIQWNDVRFLEGLGSKPDALL
ncbi:histidine phosphatase family protein [Enterococcus hermanniensis]|uniref:phosphoglycerate mutase (2,3-diphosphoglycerate-dependent) n=1 Tax=Enterococcus hermanniensis TaxID=249189 RepID=A0A1L8TP48_9ENTE|nr:histidine phosphatase family protein [Enterococcus hermanniensis]OJG46003.1 phosphoglycerate mutase [Enterococcus hermanniensis]